MMDELRFDAGTIAASYTTPDGWERVYLRLARPNWDYQYFNRDGSSRIEVITPGDLFKKSSANTAKMIPIGIGHPAIRKVNSFNVDHYIKGSTGHSVLREQTADGEFLGITATIFSEQAQQAARAFPGVSPGYSVKLINTDSKAEAFDKGFPRFNQKDRSYNHTAVGVIPRGGADVRAVFEGLRVDEDSDFDDSCIWVATFNHDCYRAPVDEAFIRPIMERHDAVTGMVEKSKVDLNRYSKPNQPDPEEESEEDDEQSMPPDKAQTKRKRGKPEGFGKQNQKKEERKDAMSTTTMQLGGITYQEVPIAFAQVVSPILQRVDSLNGDLKTAQTRIDELEAELSASQEKASGLETQLQTANTRIDELEDDKPPASSYSDDRMDEDEAMELAMNIAATVDQMRADGLMLQELGAIENFNTDFSYITDNMSQLQREMLLVANPNQRIDGYSDSNIAIAYDTAMGSIRTFAAQQRADAEQAHPDEADRQDMYYPSMGIGRGMGRKKPMLNAGLPTLDKIGQMSRPMRPTASTVRSLLNKFEKAEESFYDEATKASAPMLQHPMAAKIM